MKSIKMCSSGNRENITAVTFMSKLHDLYNGKTGFKVFSANNSFEFKTEKALGVGYLFVYLFKWNK